MTNIEPHNPHAAADRLREIKATMDDNPSRHAIAGAVHDLAEIIERFLGHLASSQDDRPTPSRFLP